MFIETLILMNYFIFKVERMFQIKFWRFNIKTGDYLVIPRGVIWKMDLEQDLSCLLLESTAPIETPSRYRNKFGQLMEHSPFCERDIVFQN